MIVDVTRDAWLGNGIWLDDPAFPGWGAIDLVIVHWPGANGVPHVGDDPADVFDYLRDQQSMYVNDPDRGYNLGYNYAVDWLGRRIEVRGDTAKNAANAPGALNARSVSIEILTNLDGAMTDEQVAGVNSVACQALAAGDPDAVVIGHRDGPMYEHGATPTQCPGDAIYARILNGEFDQPIGDDDMTADQDHMLRAIYAALFTDGNPADPEIPLAHAITQNLVCSRLWWDGYPGTIVDPAGSMAQKLKSLK